MAKTMRTDYLASQEQVQVNCDPRGDAEDTGRPYQQKNALLSCLRFSEQPQK